METQQLSAMVYRIFKTSNDLNPIFMKEIVYRSPNLVHRKDNLFVHSRILVALLKQKPKVTW